MKMDLTFTTAELTEWRRWLEENGRSVKEVWFVYYKRDSGKASLSYEDTVEEALCYGWIDSIIQTVNEEKYARKFTPRTNAHKWSGLNLQRMRKLVGTGRMTKAGLAVIDPELLKKDPYRKERPETSDEFAAVKQALKQHPRAWSNFSAMAPSYQKRYLGWICSAKQETTRQRRIEEAVVLLEQNQKLPMK
jgi:uncharacterized protein YdeI (YjbR/CyaY-like superfamily)